MVATRSEEDHDDGEHDRATRAAANDHRYTARRITIDPAPTSTLYEEFHPLARRVPDGVAALEENLAAEVASPTRRGDDCGSSR